MWTFQVLDIKFLKKKISVCGNLVVGDELLNPVKKSFKNKKWNVKRWKTIWQQNQNSAIQTYDLPYLRKQKNRYLFGYKDLSRLLGLHGE